MSLKPLRIRTALAQGLQSSLPNKLKPEILETICNLNKLKRGAADLELDYDTVIKTIQGLLESKDVLSQTLTPLELQAVSYQVFHLIQSEEFSVRDFACHFIKELLLSPSSPPNTYLLGILEQIFLKNVSRVRDEMVLKTLLEAIRHFVAYLKIINHPVECYKSIFTSIQPLVNLKDDNDDFFASFLGIKMKTRQKALKMVANRIDQVNNYKAVNSLIMPLVNYIIFGDQAQK